MGGEWSHAHRLSTLCTFLKFIAAGASSSFLPFILNIYSDTASGCSARWTIELRKQQQSIAHSFREARAPRYRLSMQTVFQALTLLEAELVRQRLEEVGIVASLRNVHLQGALGELPANLSPEVCIHNDSDYERARSIIEEMETARRTPSGPDKECPHCGESSPDNFEICWKCRREL